MIKEALVFIKETLDQRLRNRFELQESAVILNHLVEHDGSFPLKNQNKMVISLINLEPETSRQYYGGRRRVDDGVQRLNTPARFNMDLLFTASFEDHEEALKFLDATIGFFQSNSSMNSTNTPTIPKGLQRLDFDVEKIHYTEMHNLWTSMGAKYRPSVVYKIRHVTIQEDEIQEVDSAVNEVGASVEN